ncbi:MAG TPA: endolytic transglycosylase MltG [Xanthobacteraceae bacterium]|nr:endolytic transglycosylase MltG [Xanthobacteraceae bacterium]
MPGDQQESQRPRSSGEFYSEQRPIVQPRSPRQAIVPDRLPPPPSRRARNPLVMIGNGIFTGILLLIFASGGALYFGRAKLIAPGPLDRERTVVIQRGQGIRDIAETLKREGIIDQVFPFVAGAVVLRITDELKAGEYLVEPHASMRDVLAAIVEGRSILHQVTIPEGLTSEQIVQRLRDADVLTGDVAEIPKEGTLLPETYKVTRGTTRDQVLQRMAFSQRRLVQEIWDHRASDLPLKNIDEFVTLASIVEKETGKTDERPRVAAVFVNRLNKRMRLQSDPTIIYGLMGGKGSLGRPLFRSEMEEPNPYNTYINDGLPPGPIANPGRASLEATAHPARTRDLYFVADGTGGHVFSENLDQHAKNVARWRDIEKQQPDNPATPVAQPPATQQPVVQNTPGQTGPQPDQPAQVKQPPAASAPLTSPHTVVQPKKKTTAKKPANTGQTAQTPPTTPAQGAPTQKQ